MKIALAQLNYTIGDIEGNKSKIIGAVERAKSEGADLVVFAEQALSGTPALDLLCKTTFIELCEEALDEIASHCGRIAAVVGVPVLTECGTVSAAAVIQHGEVERCISKRFITARREMGFLVQGSGCETITICGERVAVIVGDDLSRTSNFDKSVDLILSINARRFGKGMMTYRYNTMHDLAYVESKRIMLINQVGGSTDIVYDGTSAVVGADGQIELLMKSFEEDFAIFDTRAEHEPIAVPYTTYKDRTRMVYSAAVCGLHDYFGKNGYTKAAIGLSGGIDSAVVACLAVDALGRENVKALLMPSQFSSDHSVVDARELADNLGIAYDVVPITEAYKAVVDTMKPVIGGTAFDATEENIQARLRTVMLMALQNKCGYILLNSSNKSENALGFCTLYGDTAGAFSVTGDLYKGEIYDLARYINKLHDDVIPDSILTKEPSSELHPGQKDSDILPPYEVVDAILFRMIEEGQHREEIVNAGFDADAQREEALPVPSRIAAFGLRVRSRTHPAADQQVRRLGGDDAADRTYRHGCTRGRWSRGGGAHGAERLCLLPRTYGVRYGRIDPKTLVAASLAGWSDGAAALAAVGGIALYYGTLYLLRERLEKKIHFKIHKQ